MTPKKDSPIRLVLLTALAVWFVTTAVAVYLSSLYSRIPAWQEIVFRFIFAGGFLLLPILLFFAFLLTVLEHKTPLWGRIASAVGVLLMLGLLVALVRAGLQSIQNAHQAACYSNIEQVALGVLLYTDDYAGCLPPAASWVDASLPYTKNIKVYKCPADLTSARSSYALNANLSGKNIKEINSPEQVVLLYETNTPGDNPAGGEKDFPIKGRHRQGAVLVAFADGHIKTYKPGIESPPLLWLTEESEPAPKPSGARP